MKRYELIKLGVSVGLVMIFFLAGLFGDTLAFWLKTITIVLLIFLTLVTDTVVDGHQRKDVLQRWFFAAIFFNMYATYIGITWIYVLAALLFIPAIYRFYLDWKER